jgi:hypothetical protein
MLRCVTFWGWATYTLEKFVRTNLFTSIIFQIKESCMVSLAILVTAILLATAYVFVEARAEVHRQEWRRQNRAYNLK